MEVFSKAFNRPKDRLLKTKKSIFNSLFFGEKKLMLIIQKCLLENV